MATTTRTTVTLDPELAAQLKELASRRKAPFETVVNDTVRAGLETVKIVRPPYKVESRPMGLRPGVDLTHALALAAELDDEKILRRYREFEQSALSPDSEDS